MDLAPAEPELDEDGNPVPPPEPELDEDGNPIVPEEPEPEPEPEPEDEDAAPLGPPPKRQAPAMTMLSHTKFVIFGGESEEVTLDDFVTLDLKDGSLDRKSVCRERV